MRTLIRFLSAMLTITPLTSFAGDNYTLTITNHMKDELLAPVLIAPLNQDKYIFDGLFVTKAAAAANQVDYSCSTSKLGPTAVVDRCMLGRGYKILSPEGFGGG